VEVELKVTELYGKWGASSNWPLLALHKGIRLLTEILSIKRHMGFGYILIPNITIEETRILREAGILVFLSKYPGSKGPRYLPVPFSEAEAYSWADDLFSSNPYLSGIVIDFETDDNGWGKRMFKGLHDAANKHNRLIGIEPHFNALETNTFMSPQDYVSYSDFLLILYYAEIPMALP
jgi:hypothetical protein